MTSDIIACLLREVGKTLADADAEVYRGLDSIHAACSIGPEMAGMYLSADPTQLTTFHEPLVGVYHLISSMIAKADVGHMHGSYAF